MKFVPSAGTNRETGLNVTIDKLCIEGSRLHSTTVQVIKQTGTQIEEFHCPRCGQDVKVTRTEDPK